MEKNCQQCNKKLAKQQNETVAVFVYRHKFCSKQCQFDSKPKVTIVCWECRLPFVVRNYRKNTAHFCSQACSSQWRDEGKRTADKKVRQSAAYKAWRTLVFERDNYSCMKCGDHNYDRRGESLMLHADHIQPFALFPELRFEVSNGRMLCVPCHKKTDTYGRGAIYRNRIASA